VLVTSSLKTIYRIIALKPLETIIIIIVIFITLMQDIYNYIRETNHVDRVCSIAAVLYLQFVLQVILFRP